MIHGSPVVAKDVLEYVVFEKYLASFYGKWRMHAKIIPDWLRHERPASLLTQVGHLIAKSRVVSFKSFGSGTKAVVSGGF